MQKPLRMGFSFGLTSGIITTLGLLVGLASGTHLKLAVAGGILTIAVADAFSDALGMHVSQEFQGKEVSFGVWHSTLATFVSKFVVASTFIVPVLVFNLSTAVWIDGFWGLGLLTIFSFLMARRQGRKPLLVALEHLGIAVLVIIASHLLGSWLSSVLS